MGEKQLNLLALDTSGPFTFVPLYKQGKIFSQPNREESSHNESVYSSINEILQTSQTSLDEIDLLLIGSGPGSFTGLRIGLAFFKGLAQCLKKPLYAYNSLQVAPYGLEACSALVVSISDAGRDQLFSCLSTVKDGYVNLQEDCKVQNCEQVELQIKSRLSQHNLAENQVLVLQNGSTIFSEFVKERGLNYCLRWVPDLSIALIKYYRTMMESVSDVVSLSVAELAALQPDYLREVHARSLADRGIQTPKRY